jgi:hypothetical protein
MDNTTARRTAVSKTAAAAPRGFPTRDYPNTTPDGLTWLDPEGNPPRYDATGHLSADFVLTDEYGYRTRYATGVKGPMLPTGKAWRIFKAACLAAREAKRRVPATVEEAVSAHLKAAGVEPDVTLPVVPEAPAFVALPPVENPPKARKASTREKRPLGELNPKQRYDRLWNEAKRQGPEAFAEFKRAWAAGEIEGSPEPKAPKVAKTVKTVKTATAPKVASEARPVPKPKGKAGGKGKGRKASTTEDRPEPGKVYALTDFAKGGPSIAAGNTWAESEVAPEPVETAADDVA